MSTKFEQTVMYSQLQPWSTAGAPPCMEPVSGPSVPPRVGISYQVSFSASASDWHTLKLIIYFCLYLLEKTNHPHPWRPTLAYEMIEVKNLAEQPVTNQLVKPCFSPSGMTTEPMNFPNLVTGFERNPQHAARAALFTRYTNNEWVNSNLTKYAESNINR